MDRDLLSQPVKNEILGMIFYAVGKGFLDISGGSMFDGTNRPKLSRGKAEDFFTSQWNRIDWKKRESILPFVEYVEQAYQCPVTSSSPHRDLDSALTKDGLKMSHGKLCWINGYSVSLPEHREQKHYPMLDRAKIIQSYASFRADIESDKPKPFMSS